MIYNENLMSDIRQSYADDGICILRELVEPQEIEKCQMQWDGVRKDLARGLERNSVRRDGFYIHGRFSAPIGEIPKNEKILSIVKLLLEEENIAVYLSRINIKGKKFSDSIHLHQDIPYFNGGVNKLGGFSCIKAGQLK